MDMIEIIDLDRYFWSLEDRYKRYVMRQLKSSLEHAGYKGIAFLHILYDYTCLYNIVQRTPRLTDIISLYKGAFTFDRRNAASRTVAAAKGLDFQGLEQLATESLVDDDSHRFNKETLSLWLRTVREFEKAQPAVLDSVILKFTVRFSVLRDTVSRFSPHFTEEHVAAEAAAILAIDEEELQNQAVLAIGKRLFPELFVPGFVSDAKEPQEPQPEQQPAKEPERMEWLGTQVQLAELFIELERKGWIRKKLPKAIFASFTNSNTIRKLFTADKDMGEATYSEVFRKNYSPKFKRIEKNKKITA